MDNDEYLNTQFMIVNIAAVLQTLDLGKFLERISRTHAIAPIIDPTLYHAAMSRLETIETIARALHTAQQMLSETDVDQLTRGPETP